MNSLRAHLFPGDQDEHGAVIGATMLVTSRGTRLLARKLFLAKDGVDYVPGQRGYRMLTANFVRECALACSEDGLAYLAIHCHGGVNSVGFSSDDMASHERGYRALLDILDGPPVGGLVFAQNAVAGDIWLTAEERVDLKSVDILSQLPEHLFPSPPPRPPRSDINYDRQARLFGDRGQAILQNQKVAIIGAGGAGALINEQLARLGVGHLIVIDPERIHPTNLPRVVGASRANTRPWLTNPKLPSYIQRLGERFRTSKVQIARRVALEANPKIQFEAIRGDITDPSVVEKIIDCDYIFLAADSMQARLVINAIVHQYLIPAVQVGVKIQIDHDSGTVTDVFIVVRKLVPGESCLWCNELINSTRLAEESVSLKQRSNQKYVDEVPAPSVVTLNAIAVSQAVNDYLFAITGLAQKSPVRWTKTYPMTGETNQEKPRRDPICSECQGRLGAGTQKRLPTKII